MRADSETAMGHPDVKLRTHSDGRVLVEVPTGSTLVDRAWLLVKPDPNGEIRWAHLGEYSDPDFIERPVG